MFRRTYVWILRLHPRNFQRSFAYEMLLIFDQVSKDQGTREVPGNRAKARLTEAKLVGDGIVSLIRQWAFRPGFQQKPAVAGPTTPALDGVPGFYMIGSFKPRPTAVIHGLILSIGVLSAALLAMKFSWNHTGHLPFPTLDREENASTVEQQRAILPTEIAPVSHAAQSSRGNPGEVEGGERPQSAAAFEKSQRLQSGVAWKQAKNVADEGARISGKPAIAGTRLRAANERRDDHRSTAFPTIRSGSPEPQAGQPEPQGAAGATNPPGADGVKLNAAERRRVIERTIATLKRYYFDREVAEKTAQALLTHESNGDDDAATDGGAFADVLTKQITDASHDMRLTLEYSRERLPEHPPEQTAEDLARYRKAMEQENCMFRKVEILRNNIGYLKLDFFPDTSVCQKTATAAMASLNHADAVIFDLRDNSGGMENMVGLIASYLFDHPEYMYSPRESPTEHSWTRSPVEGNRLADKPVYVLTSASTWSGAEQFSYDLKMLRRATLVGERTRGGAHASVFHRIDDHFGMGIPELKPINPFGKTDWEGTGVEPDVKVKAAAALETAEKLAKNHLSKK